MSSPHRRVVRGLRTRRLTALLGTAAALAGTAAVVPATASATDSAAALGTFSRNLLGASLFRQSGTSITVNGRYAFLPANRSFFTVIYANGTCDPAQAFPVGPFTTDRLGRGALNRVVTAPAAGLVRGSQSISVRRGDDATDIDGDTLLGPSDVVAVPGQPAIGLIECDSRITVVG